MGSHHVSVFNAFVFQLLSFRFADDRAPVKEKMLLAATCATFKSEFGQCYIEHEKHVTDRKDLTLDAFEAWLKAKTELGPMSEVEKGSSSF